MKNPLIPLLALILLFSSCKEKQHFYVQGNGAGDIFDIGWNRTSSEDSPFAPLTVYKPGDALGFGSGCYLIMDQRKDLILEVRGDTNQQTFINKKLVSIYINSKNKKYLTTAFKNEDLAYLKSITLDLNIDDSIIHSLNEVAKLNDDIDLIQHTDSLNNIDKLLEVFNPKLLYTALSEKELYHLNKEQQLTHLVILINDTTPINAPLPKLEKLTHLVIQTEGGLSADFLKNNPQIQDLSVFGNSDINLLKPLRNLRSLTLVDGSINNLTDHQKKQIERLVIKADTSLTADFLGTFKELSWLCLPQLQQQNSFDSIILSHPEIEVIELPADGKITDFGNATKWKKLRTMMLYGDTLANRQGLEKLSDLKLLTFPFTDNKDSSYLIKLRKALPDTTILPNDGVCVGSIWLLMLIPMVIIMLIISRIITKINGKNY